MMMITATAALDDSNIMIMTMKRVRMMQYDALDDDDDDEDVLHDNDNIAI